MKKNVGSIDKLARIILGLVALVAGYITASPWGLIGLVFIGTALINWCPLYLPLGINTRKKP